MRAKICGPHPAHDWPVALRPHRLRNDADPYPARRKLFCVYVGWPALKDREECPIRDTQPARSRRRSSLKCFVLPLRGPHMRGTGR